MKSNKMKYCLLVLLCLSSPLSLCGANLPASIHVSENKRFLVDQDGQPFFYLGDTAWELFHRLTREEADEYLKCRAEQGFTVIQAVALAELDGLRTPNAYGFLPFQKEDPIEWDEKPGQNDDYWDHVDWIVHRANEHGLYVGLLPTWGCYWHDQGRALFTPEKARVYGKKIAQRYKDCQVIWILGGDRNPENEEQKNIIRAMAQGIREGDGHTHLISYHPGGSWGSANFFHGEEWLDFNMRQNGHNHWYDIYRKTLEDYQREPIVPVMDAEPVYEDHPVAFDAKTRGHSIAADCRRALYWDLFNGAFGHTYGHHSVWQCFDEGRQGINNPLMTWRKALRQPGAQEMRYAKKLLLSYPFLTRIPATDKVLVQNPIPSAWPGQGLYHFAATMDTDSTYLMVYSPVGRTFTVRTSVLRGKNLKGKWYNPRNGKYSKIGYINKADSVDFISPNPGEFLDWILIITGE